MTAFPSNPSLNDEHSKGSVRFKWDGAKWKRLGRTFDTTSIATAVATQLSGVEDSYLMVIETPADKTYPLDAYVPVGRTITRFTAKTDSGTCNVLLAKNEATSIGLLTVSSTQNTSTTLVNATIAEGDRLYITVSSNSSASMLEIAVEYTQ